jgi:hypothetical protein
MKEGINMGLGSEILSEMMVNEAVEEHFIAMLLKEKKWEIRNGQVIKIANMETSHIKNCINLIIKSDYRWRTEFLLLLKEELVKRVD